MDDFDFFCDFDVFERQTKGDCFDDEDRSIDGKLQGSKMSGVEA